AFARAFVHAGLGVTSGMAAGIDTAAHLGALEAGGPTVAVLGTGIDVPYPRANTALHARIADEGVVVSEHPPGTGVRREQFPSRNRILAGLALGTVVVEAAERSGALITARLAADAGRDVFAVPGSIHNPMARGCHRLLRDGAALATGAADVVAALAPIAARLGRALRERLDAPIAERGTPLPPAGCEGIAGSVAYNRLWQALDHDPTGMDQLAERSGLTVAELSSMLLVMELEGRVAVAHGRYSRQSCHHAPTGAGRGK
ncbi:MAG TPA: DNA-processing protein DprA, partial [Luteimonas sp.]|nr:DNA-processing protein DprA [Luteimonas sp.]